MSLLEDQDIITILGIGCPLLTDQGFGIHIIRQLECRYRFPANVQLVDGGLIGVGLAGVIGGSRQVIAVDAIRNGGKPGDIYRLEGRQVLERLKLKNHVQQVDFLEALAHCQVLDRPPETVLIAVEPAQTDRTACELSPEVRAQTDAIMDLVLDELARLGVTGVERIEPKDICNVFSHSIQDSPHRQ